jgi:hypothetical protein
MDYQSAQPARSVGDKFTHSLFLFIGSWRNLLGGFIVVALTLVSIKFNLEMAKQMSVDQSSETLLMAGYGLLDLACVFLAGYLGAKSRSLFRRIMARLLFVFLMSLSLWAACSYALMIDAIKENTSVNNTIVEKRSALDIQRQNVVIWQDNLANTERHKTRFSKTLTKEQEKLSRIQAELSELESDLPQPTMAIYHRVAPYSPLSADALALLVRILWSVALVISPVLLLTFLAVEITSDAPPPPFKLKPKPRRWGRRITRALRRIQTNTPKSVSTTAVRTQTNTPVRTQTNTPNTDMRIQMNTPVRTQTNTVNTDTRIQTNTPVRTQTNTPNTDTRTQTDTPMRTQTNTPNTATRIQTNTPVRTQTNTSNTAKRTQTNTPKLVSTTAKRTQTNTPKSVSIRKRALPKPKEGIQRDTGTRGDAGNRYANLRQAVLDGRVKPTNRQVQKACLCGQSVASRYLQSLEKEGVIVLNRGVYTVNTLKTETA